MSFLIVSNLPCPSCGHKLRKENTACDTVWLHCANIFCTSPACDNGQEGANEHEAFNLLCVEFCLEKPKPEPEPEMSAEDERELKETRLGEWRFERDRA